MYACMHVRIHAIIYLKAVISVISRNRAIALFALSRDPRLAFQLKRLSHHPRRPRPHFHRRRRCRALSPDPDLFPLTLPSTPRLAKHEDFLFLGCLPGHRRRRGLRARLYRFGR